MIDSDDVFERLQSMNPEERRRAVSQVANEELPKSNSWIVKTMGDSDWRVRKEATGAALRRAPDPALLDELLEALLPGDNIGLRNAAVEALGGFGHSGLTALARALPTFDADGRKLAVEAMARIGDADAVAVLISLFHDEDENVCAAAIDAVAQLGPEAAAVAAPELERALENGTSYKQLVALEAINRMRVIVDWALLEPLVQDPLLRKAVTIAAGRSGVPEAVSWIRSALEEQSATFFGAGLIAGAEMALHGPAALAALRDGLKLSATTAQRLFDMALGVDETAHDQGNALIVCGALGTPEAAQVVIQCLGDFRVGKDAETAITRIGGGAVSALVRAIKDADPPRRATCVGLLGRLADARSRDLALGAIRSALSDEAEEVVAAGLEALATLGDEESLVAVMRWFNGKFPTRIRLAAGAALAAGAKRNPGLAREIVAGARADEPLAAVVALFIAALDTPILRDRKEEVQFLASAGSNPDPFVRRVVLDALASNTGGVVVDVIAFALNDEVEEVRLAAVRALGRVRDERGAPFGVDHLICLARSAHDDAMRAVALESLGTTGDTRALALLGEHCLLENPLIAVAAVEALRGFEVPARAEIALRALHHKDAEVVKAALRVLMESPTPGLAMRIAPYLAHEVWDVRRLAADLLGLLGGEEARRILLERAEDETEGLVLDAIRRSLITPCAPVRGAERAHGDDLP